jgi:integrase
MLTDAKIKSIKAPEKGRLEIKDSVVPALCLRVTPTGVKSFALAKFVEGRFIRITLGRYPELRLAQARKKAQQHLEDIADGIDPRKKQAQESKHRAIYDINKALSEYERNLKRRLRAGELSDVYITEHLRILRKEFAGPLAGKDIRDISKLEISEIIQNILERPQKNKDGTVRRAESPVIANHALTAIKIFYNWLEAQGKIETNPTLRLKKPAPNSKRKRTLADDELKVIWQACEKLGGNYAGIVQVLMLSAQRRSEVAGLTWRGMNHEQEVWEISGEENKSGRDYVVPILPLTEALIERQQGKTKTLVFPSPTAHDKIFSAWSKSKKQLDELAGVADWTLHDLRRTASTNLAKLGVRPDIKERVLNHVIPGVEGTYDRWSYVEEKREALRLLEEHYRTILEIEI